VSLQLPRHLNKEKKPPGAPAGGRPGREYVERRNRGEAKHGRCCGTSWNWSGEEQLRPELTCPETPVAEVNGWPYCRRHDRSRFLDPQQPVDGQLTKHDICGPDDF
jgi:hypothetical protein